MPVESLVEPPNAEPSNVARPAFDMSVGGRLAMVAFGYIPLLHIAACITVAVIVSHSYGYAWGAAATLATMYLAPPLATRIVRPRATLTAERYPLGSAGFLKWWYTSQWQIVFHRLPFLEEVLRLIPGLYSTWLRLWGGRIGRLVYWSPGVNLFDRAFLDIGDRVVIGADTKLSPHFLARDNDGNMELVLATISIGHDAMIGGSALIPTGVRIDPCEQTPGYKPMAPFAIFRDGQHIRTTRFNKESLQRKENKDE